MSSSSSSENEMRVARVVEWAKPFEIGRSAKATPGPREVIVKVEACGLVPNTVNIANGKSPGVRQDLPAIFGLDVAGTVESVGSDVLHLKPGDRCYVNPMITCNACPLCRSGRKDLCQFGILRGYFSFTPKGERLLNQYPIGGLTQYINSPDDKIALLPSSIDFNTGARLGYIGTAFAALKKAKITPGKTVLINGVTGTLGVAAVAIALGFGATKILGLGRNKERLEQVKGMSKMEGRIAVRSSEDEGSVVDWVQEQTGGLGVDAMIDCLGFGGSAGGTEELVKGAIKFGGMCVLLAGGADGDISSKYYEWMMRDVSVLGSVWFTDGEADEMIALIGTGIIDFSILEHKEFTLDETNKAMAFVGDRQGGFVNVVVKPHKK